jgi:hypothetical protein
MLIATAKPIKKTENYDGFGFIMNWTNVLGAGIGGLTGFLTGSGNTVSAVTGTIGGILSEHGNKPLTAIPGGAAGGVVGGLVSPLLPAGSATSELIPGFPGITGEIQSLLQGNANKAVNTASGNLNQTVAANASGVSNTFIGADGKPHNQTIVQSLLNNGYSTDQAYQMDTLITSYEAQGISEGQAIIMAENVMAGKGPVTTAPPVNNISPTSATLQSIIEQLMAQGYQAAQAQAIASQTANYMNTGMSQAQALAMAQQAASAGVKPTIMGMQPSIFYLLIAGSVIGLIFILKKPAGEKYLTPITPFPTYTPPQYPTPPQGK